MNRLGMGRAGSVMQALLDSMEGGGKIRESLAMAYWPRAAGPQVAAASHAEEVRDGILYVRTKGSVWSQEINLLKHQILAQLNHLCGKPVIKDIRFRAGGLKPAASASETGFPPADEIAAVRLSEEDAAAMAADLEAAGKLEDPGLRRATLQIIERQYRVRRWRLNRGWKPCARCGALHGGDQPICTVCRAEEDRPPTTPVPIE